MKKSNEFFASLIANLAMMSPLFAQSGTIPSQSYSSSQLREIISPQMTSRHLNQPSVFNGYAILAGNAVHEVWDISNPFAPESKATFSSNHAAGEAESHQVSYGQTNDGKYYLCTISGRGIDLWDLTDTTSPVLTSELILPNINYGDVEGAIWGVCWQGDYIYAGATSNGLYVIDVSDPTAPVLVKTLTMAEIGGVSAGPLFALGDLLVITTPKRTAGIATLDISTPLSPKLLDAVNPTEGASYIGGFYGTHAFLITPYRAYDVTSNPRNISLTGTITVPNSEYVSFANNHLYLGGLRGGTQGIYDYDISDPSTPVLQGRINGRSSSWDDQFSVPIGNLILIADDQKVNNQYVGAVIAVNDTTPDTTPLSVIATYPKNQATGQSLSGQVAVSFSEWPEFATVNQSSFFLRPTGGSPLEGTWSCTYTTATFTTSTTLLPFTEYEIVLSANGVKDLVGNATENEFISTFRTGSGVSSPDNQDVILSPTQVNLATTLSIASPNNNQEYHWELGDGSIATGASISHTYTSPGRYNGIVRSSQSSTVYEAETATLNGGVVVATDNTGYTGSGYADYPGATGSAVSIAWDVVSHSDTQNTLSFRYALGSATSRPLELFVNNISQGIIDFTTTNDWTEWSQISVPDIAFIDGTNTVELRASAGSAGANLDSLTVLTDGTSTTTTPFTQIVYRPLASTVPTSSQPIIIDGDHVWAVHPDSNVVSMTDAVTLTQQLEVSVGGHPVSLAQAPSGDIWALCRDNATIAIIDASDGSLKNTVSLPYASAPSGLAFMPDQSAAIVTLSARHEVVKLNPSTGAVVDTLVLPTDPDGQAPKPAAISILSSIYVTRAISPKTAGQVYRIDPSSFSLSETIDLAIDTGPDSSKSSRGLPNYLHNIAISPDGARAWIPSKKDNIQRGAFLDGLDLEHDVTVRAISSTIDLVNNVEVPEERIDHDNLDRGHGVSFSNFGDLAFVTFPGNNLVTIVDAYGTRVLDSLFTEDAPIGTALHSSTGRLFTINFLSRSLSVHDISSILNGGSGATALDNIPTVSNEQLPPQVLQGKKLFYSAGAAANLDGYMSCASCHIDGAHDGQTYDFTSLGEGFRNTIDLRGRAGTAHGRLHWSANFDEIQDFEGQMRGLGDGDGLMSDADFAVGTRSHPLGIPKGGISSSLDALASYVESLDSYPPSPYRQSNGELTSDGLAGKTIFESLNCSNCHGGEHFTDSPMGGAHDVGTILSSSGSRLSQTLNKIDTPTLRGIWDTAPYLHDGSAPTLRDVLITKNPSDTHGNISTLTTNEVDQLISYLKQIDGSEPNAIEATSPGTNTFQNFISSYQLTGQDASPEADVDNDGFSNYLEFYLGGTAPNNSASSPLIIQQLSSASSSDHLTLSALLPEGGIWKNGIYEINGVSIDAEFSTDLNLWDKAFSIIENPENLPATQNSYFWNSYQLNSSTSDLPKSFGRMKIGDSP